MERKLSKREVEIIRLSEEGLTNDTIGHRLGTEEHSALLVSFAERERTILELRSKLAMIHLSMNEVKATVWATDRSLKIGIIADGEFSTEYFGSRWTKGSSIHDLFKTDDNADKAIAAHHAALSGEEAQVLLSGDFTNLLLRVLPFPDDAGDVIGCISILNRVSQA